MKNQLFLKKTKLSTIVNSAFLFCFSFFIIFSCEFGENNRKLKSALDLAGANKEELLKVIDHYKKDPADSLKLRAARFLIENMQWHFGSQVKPSAMFWDLFLREDSLAMLKLQNPGNSEIDIAYQVYKHSDKEILVPKAITQSLINGELHSDLLNLNSDFLIENIDAAFKVKGKDLCKRLSFDDFCEFVLPYRFNNEPVYLVRKKLSGHFDKLGLLDSLQQNPYGAVSRLNKYVELFNWEWTDKIANPDMGFYNLFYWNHVNCTEAVATYGCVMRSAGLPVGESFTPKWRNANGGHSWCTLLNPDGSLTLFTAVYQTPGGLTPLYPARATKIFRKTFASQPESPFFLKAPDEMVPSLFNSPCILDITGQIIPAHDIELNLLTKQTGKNLCWFSVFRMGQWAPVGWGTLNRSKNKAAFKEVSFGLTGVACSFDGSNTVPCSKLVTVTPSGLEYISPGEKKINLLLTRKYPINERLEGIRKEMIGTKIQGANHPDFSDAVTVHVIDSILQPYFQDVVFENPGSFRYYRLEAPTWQLNVAELEFIAENELPGTVEATPLPVFTREPKVQKKFFKYTDLVISGDSTMFDGDLLTFSGMKRAVIDFINPRKINRIRIAPRNSHNGIITGDNYQLFYWDNDWISAGIKQAQFNFLEYPDVPENTLYWLRNLDHGKEEQPFFYKNGKQVFSNQALQMDKK